jgi:hypothetical protein
MLAQKVKDRKEQYIRHITFMETYPRLFFDLEDVLGKNIIMT